MPGRRRAGWAAGRPSAGEDWGREHVPPRRARHPRTRHRSLPRPVHPRLRRDPRWGQLARPRLHLRRRDAAVHGLRPGAVAHRRRRPPLRRPDLLVGPDDPRPRAPGGRRGGPGGGGRRAVVRRADAGRDRARRGDHRAGRAGRAGAAGQLGHGGDDERRPARPRDHRAHRGRQVRRLLPRPRRRPARPGRIGGRDARPAHQPGRHRSAGRRHDRAALQRPRRRARRVRPARRRDRVRDHRGRRGQHGCDRPAARVQRRAEGAVRRARRSADHGRGDDRLPGLPLGLVRPRGCRRRPLHVRQGHVGRAAGGGVRRSGRADGPPRPGRPGLPGGDAVREPGRGRRGPGHAAARRRRRLRPARRQRGPAGRADRRRAVGRGRAAHRGQGREHALGVLHRRAGRTTTPGRRPRRPGASPRSSTLCSLAGSTRRRAPSRRGSSRRPWTTTPGRRSRTPCRTPRRPPPPPSRRRTRHSDERDHGRAPRGGPGDHGQPDPHRRAPAPPRGGAQPGPHPLRPDPGFPALARTVATRPTSSRRRSPTPT